MGLEESSKDGAVSGSPVRNLLCLAWSREVSVYAAGPTVGSQAGERFYGQDQCVTWGLEMKSLPVPVARNSVMCSGQHGPPTFSGCNRFQAAFNGSSPKVH